MDRSRVKWRLKLAAAFRKSHSDSMAARNGGSRFGWLRGSKSESKEGRSGKWALFLLPFITLLREGLEAVVFVGGVSCSGLPKTKLIPGLAQPPRVVHPHPCRCRSHLWWNRRLPDLPFRIHRHTPLVPRRLDLLPLPHRCWSRVKRCLVLGILRLCQGCRRRCCRNGRRPGIVQDKGQCVALDIWQP